MERVRKFLKKVIFVVQKPYMRVLPGQLAFFTVLSLIPLVAVVGTLATYFSLSLNSLEEILNTFFPTDLSVMFTSSITGKGLTFNIVVFLFSAFILASNGAHSVIITSNEIYGIKGRGYIGRRFKAIAITFLLVWIIFFSLAVPVFGDTLFEALFLQYGHTKFLVICNGIYMIIKIPVTMILMFLAVKMIYAMAPDEEVPTKENLLGPFFTTVLWIIGTEIYSIYVKYFSNYNLFYGSISNIIILMIWVYYLAYVFVLGMAISATSDKELNLTKQIELSDLTKKNRRD